MRSDSERRVIVYSNAGIVVACNLGPDTVTVEEALGAERVLSSAAGTGAELPPESVAVWSRG